MLEFTVVIPVYNTSGYLAECLDSLIAQTEVNWEAICVNDGSTDGSELILQHYSDLDARIRYVNQVNAGVSVARNKGLDLAKGEFVLFLDSDDSLAPQALQLIRDAQQKHSDAWVMFGVRKYYLSSDRADESMGALREYHRFPLSFKLRAKPLSLVHSYAVNKVFSRAILNDHQLRFRDNVPLNEDMLFVFQYAYYMRNVVCIHDDLYFYRMHENSVCGRFKQMDRPAQDYLNHVTMYTDLLQSGQYQDHLHLSDWQLGICLRICDTYTWMLDDMKRDAAHRPELIAAFQQAMREFLSILPIKVKLMYLPTRIKNMLWNFARKVKRSIFVKQG